MFNLNPVASALISSIASGKLKMNIFKVYDLVEAPQAHKDLEGRVSTGKLVLKCTQ